MGVAPLAGAWIEITEEHTIFHHGPESLPSRERGLKFFQFKNRSHLVESLPSRERGLKFLCKIPFLFSVLSLPSRERGLKLIGFLWISCMPRRSPRGSVD